MTLDEQKRAAAEAAMGYVVPRSIVGVGTGSTADFFISALAARPGLVAAAVASSEASAAALRAAGIAVVGLDAAPSLPLYVDGADEVDPHLRLIKGAGGALAREKVLASAATLFVCIVDESKLVERLGGAPVPLAVLPMAGPIVVRRVRDLGGRPVPRAGFRSDDGAAILDVTGLDLSDPERLEADLDAIPGVLECGVFALRRADVVLAGTGTGVSTLGRPGVTPA
jgi:ribose 5-phosphate isomerase A